MRHRSGFTRALAAIFAVWFAVTLGDPGTLHSCPMHGAGHAHAAQPAASHDVAHATVHHVSPHAPQPGAPAQSGPCTCVGQCCAAPTALPLRTVATLAVPAAIAQPGSPLLAPRLDAPAPPDHRLPLANGPPAA